MGSRNPFKGRRKEGYLNERAANEAGDGSHSNPITFGTDPIVAQAFADHSYLVIAVILEIFGGCDGWLRASPQDDGKVFWKWKFTSHQWPNHYVMYVQEPLEATFPALQGFLRKIENVRTGREKPVQDRFFR